MNFTAVKSCEIDVKYCCPIYIVKICYFPAVETFFV